MIDEFKVESIDTSSMSDVVRGSLKGEDEETKQQIPEYEFIKEILVNSYFQIVKSPELTLEIIAVVEEGEDGDFKMYWETMFNEGRDFNVSKNWFLFKEEGYAPYLFSFQSCCELLGIRYDKALFRVKEFFKKRTKLIDETRLEYKNMCFSDILDFFDKTDQEIKNEMKKHIKKTKPSNRYTLSYKRTVPLNRKLKKLIIQR